MNDDTYEKASDAGSAGSDASSLKNAVLSPTEKYTLKKLLKFLIDSAVEHERLRKELSFAGFSNENVSTSSLLLDAYLLASKGTGNISYADFDRVLQETEFLKK